ncbi:MAG TPA: HEAT repeat domain-containing protein [Kofleriaceae bacterium]|nr:HEAT repeat domain-containing protein [Kofleriaceae bacterium]
MRGGLYGVVGAALVVLVAPAPARADDVTSWISLIEKQPAGVDRATWKEERRDAARKLVASHDRRAVPVMITLAQNETFDIIGEVAIEGLGTLGDPDAIPVLEAIAADASRDREQRDLARKSLAKLGAKPGKPPGPTTPPVTTTTTPPVTTTTTPPVTTTTPPVTTTTPPVTTAVTTPPAGGGDADHGTDEPVSGLGDALLGTTPGALPTDLPTFADDVLAATEQVTLSAGVASLSYDTVRDRLAFDLDGSGRYRRRLEREARAWGFDGGARLIASDVDPDGEDRSREVLFDADATADIRFYGGPRLYGTGVAAFSTELQYIGTEKAMGTPYRDARFATDLQVGLGGGYGRVLDVGTRLRLRQLEVILKRERSLGRPIDDAVARKLQAAWWAERRDRTGFRQLASTVSILREAGILLGEPLSSTTYELLEVLRDPSFDDRADGFDVQLLFGEGYLLREDDPAIPEGRIEMVLVHGRAARNLNLMSDVQGHLDARYRILAPDGTPAPWRVSLGGGLRRFVHGDHGELLGGLDVGAELTLSDDDLDQTDVGMAIAGTVGWSATLNRASRLRLGADAKVDSGELFLGASLTASYGWLDAGFARSVPSGL